MRCAPPCNCFDLVKLLTSARVEIMCLIYPFVFYVKLGYESATNCLLLLRGILKKNYCPYHAKFVCS